MSTGEKLGAFYKELISNGVPEDMAEQIVVGAAREVIGQNGLSVTEVSA